MPALKVVYCLTSSGGDLYEAMTRVSLATVRLTNPTARIEIATGQQTHLALQATGSQLLREADACMAIPSPTACRFPSQEALGPGLALTSGAAR